MTGSFWKSGLVEVILEYPQRSIESHCTHFDLALDCAAGCDDLGSSQKNEMTAVLPLHVTVSRSASIQ